MIYLLLCGEEILLACYILDRKGKLNGPNRTL